MKQKQLAKGIDQLMDEGVAQLFINQFNGRKIIGTVGQLQFEVIQYRLEMNIMQNADGSLSAYTRHVGWKVMTRKNWKLSKT